MTGRPPAREQSAGSGTVPVTWEEAITHLEQMVDVVERLATSPDPAATADAEPEVLEPWAPPPLEGPVPAELVARARHLLQRQAVVRVRLESALEQSRDDLARTRRLGPQHRAQASSYVDVSA
ncbi:hypothetical protein L2K70_11585 [Nocardioides KLBMP 9356]|uniref:Flagellar protein FliT n=1 Tax=Nocardioides potassii TaxID=2911371 RepID=A0ABS9HDD7_9ACTN|nr:hypothetical protein [Nocardioides potassii]MCF6378245.1 hypothetical protein [Nocardioides potassii]